MKAKNFDFKYKLLLFAPLTLFFLTVCFIGVSTRSAQAAHQKTLDVEQVGEIVYCGVPFLDEEGGFVDTDPLTTDFENELFFALQFRLDGQTISLSHENARVEHDGTVCDPGRYVCSVSATYDGVEYTQSAVQINISKRVVTVLTLLNGKTELTVQEGTKVLLAYDYQGAIPAHTEQVVHSGVTVTEIGAEYLTVPAWADVDTTKPTESYRVVAAHAESPYYNFRYASSVLTIKASSVGSLTFADETATQLIIAGDFSVLHTVKYTDVGVSPSSERYSVLSVKADALYKDTGFFDKYEKTGAFSVELFYNNNRVTQSTPVKVMVYKPSLNTSKKYKIIALYDNGNNDILDAKLEEGYLSFDASDVGDFIIVSEIEGLSMTYYALVIAGGIGVLVIVVLLVAVFRRKY